MIRHPHRQSFHRTHGHVNTKTRRMLLALVAFSFVVCAIPLFLTQAAQPQAPTPIYTAEG